LPTTLEQRACRIVGQRVHDDRTTQGTPGVVVGVVLPPVGGAAAVRLELHYGEAVLAAGSTPGTPATDATHWEMGSETKLFTGLLLAWLAPTTAGGSCAPTARVCLTDPISRFLPADVVAAIGPQKAAITLLQLATHTSGLPDDPPNLHDGCPLDPITKRHEACTNWRQLYTEDLLWQGVQQSTLAFTPGEAGRWLYSDTGFAVLGAVLADVADPGQPSPPYAGVVATNLTGPLGLTDTGPEVDTDPLLAMGYQYASSVAAGSPSAAPRTAPRTAGNTIVTAPRWNNTNAFIGGGGSPPTSAMTRFVAATLGYEAGPLASARPNAGVAHQRASASMTWAWPGSSRRSPGSPTYAFKERRDLRVQERHRGGARQRATASPCCRTPRCPGPGRHPDHARHPAPARLINRRSERHAVPHRPEAPITGKRRPCQPARQPATGDVVDSIHAAPPWPPRARAATAPRRGDARVSGAEVGDRDRVSRSR
jgi:CubicO group peptidase (beta-lactamase class C family)